MSTTTETLEDIYKLTDHYTSPLAKLTHEVVSFGGVVSKVIGLASTLGTIALGALGKSALDNALQIERLTGTFTALTGSADAAGKKLDWLQKFAQTSIGEFADLADAGAQLEASGLNMERILPQISNISAAFGGTKEQVMELASAFSRLPSGVFGESMEIFRRFGVTAGDLMAQGLKQNGNGQFQATAEQMLTAVEAVSKKKFGDIGNILGNSLGVKISNLKDAWTQMTATFGQTFFPMLTRAVETVTQLVNFLKDSGWVKSFGESISSTLGQMFGGGGDSLLHGFTFILGFLENLPQVISVVWNFLRGMFTELGQTITGILNQMIGAVVDSANLIGKAIYDLANLAHKIPGIGGIIPEAGKFNEMKKPHVAGLGDFAGMAASILPGGLGDIFNDSSKRGDELFKKFQAYQQRPNQGAPGFDGGFFNSQYSTPMQQVAANTQQIADNTNPLKDLKKFVVGGGPLAAMGITPAELGRGRRSVLQVEATGGGRHLDRALSELFTEFLAQAMQQGVVAPVQNRAN